MNHQKARECFSSYYEGKLEPGLKESLERQFATDTGLHAEYKSFVQVVEAIEQMAKADVEIPFDLHDRITRRLDFQLYEQKRSAAPKFSVWWRSLTLGGVAAAAILSAIVALRPSNGPSVAGAISGAGSTELSVVYLDNVTRLQLGTSQSEVTVTEIESGTKLKSIKLLSQSLDAPILNPRKEPVAISARRSESKEALTFVVPGTNRKPGKDGSGTVMDFGLAISGHFGMPVSLSGNSSTTIKWKLEGVLSPRDVSVEPASVTMSVVNGVMLVVAD